MGSTLRLLCLLFLLLEVVVMVKVVVGWVDTRISGGGVVAQPFQCSSRCFCLIRSCGHGSCVFY